MQKSKQKVAGQPDASAKKLSMEALNKKFADAVFRVLQFDGHYSPHLTASFSSAFSGNTMTNGPCSSHVLIQVATDVCAKPPSKKTVLVRLYELIYENEIDSPCVILGDDKIPSEWIWTLIENLSKPCSHFNDDHHAETDADCGMHFVEDCFDDMPIFQLGSGELLALDSLAKKKRCCDVLDIVKEEKNLKNYYNYTVAADIVSAHMRSAEPVVQKKAYYMKGLWEIIVKREILQLVEKGSQPQEQSSRKGPTPARQVIAELMAKNEAFHPGWTYPTQAFSGADQHRHRRK